MKSPFGSLFFLWIGHFLIDYMVGVWAIYKTIAGLDIALAGMIAGFSALAGEGMQLIFGTLSDRGYRMMLIALGLLGSTASAFMGYTEEYSILFLLFFLTCLGSGAFHPAAAGLVGKIATNRRSLFMSIFQSGGMLGLAFSQIIFVSVYQYFNGKTAILILPAICLVAVLAFLGLADSATSYVKPTRRIDLKVFLRFFKFRDLRNLYFTQLLTQTHMWALIFMLPDLLIYRGYPDSISLGLGHFSLIMGGAIMIIPAGWLADRISAQQVIIGAQATGLVAFYTLLAFPLLSAFQVCCLLFIIGSALGTITPVAVGMGTAMAPSRPSMVSAFLMGLVWCVAEGLGQGGGGLLAKAFSENAVAKALMIIGGSSVAAIFFSIQLPREISDEEKWEVAL